MFILCLVRGEEEGERVRGKQRCCQEKMKNANGLSEREFLMIDISKVYQRSVNEQPYPSILELVKEVKELRYFSCLSCIRSLSWINWIMVNEATVVKTTMEAKPCSARMNR